LADFTDTALTAAAESAVFAAIPAVAGKDDAARIDY
jgi:hypothetical protein